MRKAKVKVVEGDQVQKLSTLVSTPTMKLTYSSTVMVLKAVSLTEVRWGWLTKAQRMKGVQPTKFN